MVSNSSTNVLLSADGTPLKKSLSRSLRQQKMRALLLIAPLLIFILVAFIMPIVSMLSRSVENELVGKTLPLTVQSIQSWDALVYHFTSRGSRFNKHAGGSAGNNSQEWLHTTNKNMRNFIRKWGTVSKSKNNLTTKQQQKNNKLQITKNI